MITSKIDLNAAAGTIDCLFYRPSEQGAFPGIIMLTDIMGIRPAFEDMAKKLCGQNYAVLLPNIYYVHGRVPLFDHVPSMQNEADSKTLRAWAEELRKPGVMAQSGAAMVDGMLKLPGVQPKLGAVGYCLTGEMAVDVAAERPDTVLAAASYHGTSLAPDNDPDGAHLKLGRAAKTRFYFGHATNDQSCPAPVIAKLEDTAKAAGADFKSEMYEAEHGFAVAGGHRYSEKAAARHWDTLLALFKAKLGLIEGSA